MTLSVVELIAKKRDGAALTEAEIRGFIEGFTENRVTDYQMSAFLMAVFFRGMSDEETVALTRAMLHSGDVLDLEGVSGFKVDKHSTGGVGDKVSISLAPLVASCGVPVPMVSGRGLGHTGGTLDKLEAIPGFRTDLSVQEFKDTVRAVGTSMIGQTREIAPADKRIYALRDVTATVECIPLIVASILSKKLAEGIDGLVLDVKVGRGAFMKDLEHARALANALVRVGKGAGKKVTALLTDMDSPLGNTIGNAIETREAIELLHGKGPRDLVECTLALGIEMLELAGAAASAGEARAMLEKSIAQGDAVRTLEKMIERHHGDPRVASNPERLEIAKEAVDILATSSGVVRSIHALEVGLVGVALGAGRTRADQAVDPAVGIEILKKPGESTKKGEAVARVFVRDRASAEAVRARLEDAFEIGEAPASRPLVLERIS